MNHEKTRENVGQERIALIPVSCQHPFVFFASRDFVATTYTVNMGNGKEEEWGIQLSLRHSFRKYPG